MVEIIANDSGAVVRADINTNLTAAFSSSYGPTEPALTFAGMFWVDSSSTPSTLKVRTDADDAWVDIGVVDPTGFLLSGTTAFTRLLLAQTTAALARVQLGITGTSGQVAIFDGSGAPVGGLVDTAQIADEAVTFAKIGAGQVFNSRIADEAVGIEKLKPTDRTGTGGELVTATGPGTDGRLAVWGSNGNLASGDGPVTTVTDVLTALGAGGLGTYALLRNETYGSGSTTYAHGVTVPGSDLVYVSASGTPGGGVPSGTWRSCGRFQGPSALNEFKSTVFQRIA